MTFFPMFPAFISFLSLQACLFNLSALFCYDMRQLQKVLLDFINSLRPSLDLSLVPTVGTLNDMALYTQVLPRPWHHYSFEFAEHSRHSYISALGLI